MRRLPLAAAGAALALLASPAVAVADRHGHDDHHTAPHTFAVIGDLPYGDTVTAELPAMIEQINAGRPGFTVHVGDIKSGSTLCDDATYTSVKAAFDTFRAPLVYTPGDNEWTDCHRPNNGAYQPLERLAHLRSVFFAHPGRTLGADPVRVRSQARYGIPENVRWSDGGVDLATLHVVGSNDDLAPWTGVGETAATPEQVAEERARMAAAVRQVRETFEEAREEHHRAVAFFLQADMFDPTYTPTWADISAFQPLVRALVDGSRRFPGEVYLFNGDSHSFVADRPLAAGSPWLTTYGVRGSADNLQRVTVDGSANADKDWLRVTVSRSSRGPALTWERVPYVLPAPTP